MYYETQERHCREAGTQYAPPFVDLRVVRAALMMPVEATVPVPQPKPALSQALLGSLGPSRVKVQSEGYIDAHANAMQDSFPWAFEPGNLCSQNNLVRPEGLLDCRDPRWRFETLALVPVEMWLRKSEE